MTYKKRNIKSEVNREHLKLTLRMLIVQAEQIRNSGALSGGIFFHELGDENKKSDGGWKFLKRDTATTVKHERGETKKELELKLLKMKINKLQKESVNAKKSRFDFIAVGGLATSVMSMLLSFYSTIIGPKDKSVGYYIPPGYEQSYYPDKVKNLLKGLGRFLPTIEYFFRTAELSIIKGENPISVKGKVIDFLGALKSGNIVNPIALSANEDAMPEEAKRMEELIQIFDKI